MTASLTAEAFGTITPFSDSYKIGLDDSNPPIIKAVSKSAVAKWTVQNFDDATDFYRLFVNDGKKDYALNARENNASIFTSEGSPASSDSHVWYIFPVTDKYYYIRDTRTPGATGRAWKLNGTAVKSELYRSKSTCLLMKIIAQIELAPLPIRDDELAPFKFSFTFSG